MTELMTENECEVEIDESCCMTWRRSSGTRDTCSRAVRWEIQRNGEPMAVSCSRDLERVLALVYSYEPDESVLLHVVPTHDLTVTSTVRGIEGTASASLRPIPVGCPTVLRGDVRRDDRLPVPSP